MAPWPLATRFAGSQIVKPLDEMKKIKIYTDKLPEEHHSMNEQVYGLCMNF